MCLLPQLLYTYYVVLHLCCWALESCNLGMSHSLRNCQLLKILHIHTECHNICYCKAKIGQVRQLFD